MLDTNFPKNPSMADFTSIFSLIFISSFIFFNFPATFSTTDEQNHHHHHQEHQREEFNEELLLKPLPDRKVLAHFSFDSSIGFGSSSSSFHGGSHLRLFPKSIFQLVQKYRIKELELSFTQGRWNYERWGGFDPISNKNAKPPGVELWAVFDAPPSQVDVLWKNLTHTLSGLFCASINFLESSTSYSAPEWGFRTSPGHLRYGTLPREAVCTENLTPWLKLLPCRDKAGLSELMDRPSIYRGFYHSQRLHLVSSGFSSDHLSSNIQLDQSLTVVLQPANQGVKASAKQPNWSFSSIFGRTVTERCILAKSSNMYLHLDGDVISILKDKGIYGDDAISENIVINSVFELSSPPDKITVEASDLLGKEPSILHLYLIEKHVEAEPFDFALTWKVPVVWSCSQAPLLANRFLMGSGNERGAIVITLTRAGHIPSVGDTDTSKDKCSLRVNVFQVVPWYVKVYYHTLQVFVDGQVQLATNVIEKMHVSPSEDKVSPGSLELALKFPCQMNSSTISLDFDKGFLHIDEYPPDANQGFDIPSAVISFPDFHSSLSFADDSNLTPLLSKLKKTVPAVAYTEVLLVPLTTPDFSMPYNVLTITCTVFALYFGSVLNVLRRRADEEERLLKQKAKLKRGRIPQLLQKLISRLRGRPVEDDNDSLTTASSSSRAKLILKVVVVVLFAVGYQFYVR